jgi:hypothetical protein
MDGCGGMILIVGVLVKSQFEPQVSATPRRGGCAFAFKLDEPLAVELPDAVLVSQFPAHHASRLGKSSHGDDRAPRDMHSIFRRTCRTNAVQVFAVSFQCPHRVRLAVILLPFPSSKYCSNPTMVHSSWPIRAWSVPLLNLAWL